MSDEQAPLIMHRRGSMLVPHGPMDDELVRKFPSGVPLRVRAAQPRNPRALRYYFALLSLVRENLPEPAPDVDTLHEAVKVMLGYTLTVKTPRGDIVLPGSVAFDKMEEPAFRQYLDAFKQLVITRIIPGVDMPAFEKAAREMLGAPLDAEPRRRAVREEPDEDDEDPFTAAPDEDDDDESPFGPDEDEDDYRPDDDGEAPYDNLQGDQGDGGLAPHLVKTITQVAERAAKTGRPRELPPGLDAEEGKVWYAAYDAARPAQPQAAGEVIDPETGEVTEAAPPKRRRGARPQLAVEGASGVKLTSVSHPDPELDAAEDWQALKALIRQRRSAGDAPNALTFDKMLSLADAPAPFASDYDAMWMWLAYGARSIVDIDAAWPLFWRGAAYKDASKDERAAISALLVERQGALR